MPSFHSRVSRPRIAFQGGVAKLMTTPIRFWWQSKTSRFEPSIIQVFDNLVLFCRKLLFAIIVCARTKKAPFRWVRFAQEWQHQAPLSIIDSHWIKDSLLTGVIRSAAAGNLHCSIIDNCSSFKWFRPEWLSNFYCLGSIRSAPTGASLSERRDCRLCGSVCVRCAFWPAAPSRVQHALQEHGALCDVRVAVLFLQFFPLGKIFHCSDSWAAWPAFIPVENCSQYCDTGVYLQMRTVRKSFYTDT